MKKFIVVLKGYQPATHVLVVAADDSDCALDRAMDLRDPSWVNVDCVDEPEEINDSTIFREFEFSMSYEGEGDCAELYPSQHFYIPKSVIENLDDCDLAEVFELYTTIDRRHFIYCDQQTDYVYDTKTKEFVIKDEPIEGVN